MFSEFTERRAFVEFDKERLAFLGREFSNERRAFNNERREFNNELREFNNERRAFKVIKGKFIYGRPASLRCSCIAGTTRKEVIRPKAHLPLPRVRSPALLL